jgi:hypothetical protein
MKLLLIIIIASFLNLKTYGQVNSVTSIGAGYETSRTAISIQLATGVNIGRSEMVIGYTVFFHAELPHRGDGELPQIIYFRYGLNLLPGNLQIMPLIGAGIVTATVLHDELVHNYHELVGTPRQIKILYGLKAQKQFGLGGLFTSYEHCSLSYFNIGMFVRID